MSQLNKEIINSLAKELGYKDVKDMKAQFGSRGTLKQRLERGEAVGESIKGLVSEKIGGYKRKIKSTKDFFTKSKDFRKGLAGMIPGDNLLGAFIRGKIRPKGGDDGLDFSRTSPSQISPEELSSVAKDVATIRQAVSTLLEFERENQEQSEKEKQAEFLKQQDAKEAELEASRVSPQPVTQNITTPKAPGESAGGGIKNIFSNIISNLIGGLKKAFRFIFKPSKLLKVLARGFPLALIAISLFKGISAGFDRWKETGSISEAIIAGLGAIVDFVSFGLFGEDTVRSVFETVGGWISKIKDTLVDTFYDIKDWFVNNVGIPQFSFKIPFKDNPVTVGPYYPFKDNTKSSTPEYSKRPSKTDVKKTDTKSTKKEDIKATSPKPLAVKPQTERELLQEKAKDVIGMDISNMSEDEIEKMIPKGMNLDDFTDVDGKLQLSGFDPNAPTQIVKPGGGLETLVQQAGGDEASSGLQKDSAKLNNFTQGGGLSSKFSELSKGSSSISGSMDSASSNISAKIKAGGVTPEPVSPFGSATSGDILTQGSADVESGQRMESMPDMGNIFNSPNITNNQSSMGKKKLPPADVFNSDFANVLMRT